IVTSRFKIEIYTAEKFIKNTGTILFQLSTYEIYILYLLYYNKYILLKSRCNLNKSRRTTIIYKTTKETDILYRLLPINLVLYVYPAIKIKYLPD
ncbi:hypothetical protein QBC41DRAFT_234482, partial [Cercophora samala]